LQSSFLDEGNVNKKLIPSMYELFAKSIADNFAQNQLDKTLFEKRITTSLTKEQYVEIGEVMTTLLFQTIREAVPSNQLVINMEPLRVKVTEILPDILKAVPACYSGEFNSDKFRFCKPYESFKFENRNEVNTMFLREIPTRYVVNNGFFIDLIPIFKKIVLYSDYFVYIYSLSLLFFVAIVGLLIYKPFYNVLRWCAIAFFTVGILVFIGSRISVKVLQGANFLSETDFSEVQIGWIRLLIQYFSDTLFTVGVWHLIVVLILFAISTFIKNIYVESPKA